MSSILLDLPKKKWFGVLDLHQWQGSWYDLFQLKGAIASQSDFEAHDDDVILASSIKTGTTWLKALIPCIMHYDDQSDLLISNHPNSLIPSLEMQIYNENPSHDLSSMSSPRLFRTHMSYAVLPQSIKKSNCKIVYITRNPKDTFVSMWHFAKALFPPQLVPPSFELAFKGFCDGVHPYGPFFDHVLEYWKESCENPEKILFLKYEEMKSDPKGQVKKLAAFLGKPLANDEQVDKVLWRCSLDRLKNLEVNKKGVDTCTGVPKNAYFRKGIVGDWKNCLTDDMVEQLDYISKARLEGSGFEF